MIFKKKIKNETEFLPAALEIIETPPSPLGGTTVWLIFAIIITAIVWACIGEVDEVANARGKFIPDGNIKVIQSMDNGTIKNIHVKEGEKIKKGDILIELDSTVSEVELLQLNKTLEIAKLEREILSAMLTNDDEKINSLLNDSEKDLLSKAFLMTQEKFKNSREQDYNKKTEGFNLNIEKAKSELIMIESEHLAVLKKIEIYKNDLEKMKTLYDSGSIPYSDYQNKQNEVDLLHEEEKLQATKIKVYEEQLKLQRKNAESHTISHDGELLKEIVDKDKLISNIETELTKAYKKLEFQTIVSPVDGTVHGISENTIGGVITSAKPLVSIVPAGTPLIIEGKVLNRDIGFIREGQNVEIKLDTFPFQKYGVIKGEIIQISPDAVEDKRLGFVYKIRVKPERETIFIDSKDVKVSSGMTAVVEVKLGKRKIIEFFLPAIDYVKDSFKLR